MSRSCHYDIVSLEVKTLYERNPPLPPEGQGVAVMTSSQYRAVVRGMPTSKFVVAVSDGVVTSVTPSGPQTIPE